MASEKPQPRLSEVAGAVGLPQALSVSFRPRRMTVLSMWENTSDWTAMTGQPVSARSCAAAPSRSHCITSLATVGTSATQPGLRSRMTFRARSRSLSSPPLTTSASLRSVDSRA